MKDQHVTQVQVLKIAAECAARQMVVNGKRLQQRIARLIELGLL